MLTLTEVRPLGVQDGAALAAAAEIAWLRPPKPVPAATVPCLEGTIGKAFTLTGRGLHTGRRGGVRVEPAPPGHGIVFHRGHSAVPATWAARTAQPLCNALRFPDGRIARLVEHLMAALAAHGIDHAAVHLDGEELPIFDGSASSWCEAITGAGRRIVGGSRRAMRITRPIEVAGRCSRLRIDPADALSLDVMIALRHLGPMRWQGEVTPAAFARELAPARSFGRLSWALPAKIYGFLTRQPILRGAHFGSAAALWGGRVIGGMRLEQEPVRHRALDLVGDLALAGYPVLGHVTAVNPGHEMNSALVGRILASPDSWDYVDLH